MSSTAAVVCMTSSTRTMERVFVASARSEASKGVLIGRKAAARRVETRRHLPGWDLGLQLDATCCNS